MALTSMKITREMKDRIDSKGEVNLVIYNAIEKLKRISKSKQLPKLTNGKKYKGNLSVVIKYSLTVRHKRWMESVFFSDGLKINKSKHIRVIIEWYLHDQIELARKRYPNRAKPFIGDSSEFETFVSCMASGQLTTNQED